VPNDTGLWPPARKDGDAERNGQTGGPPRDDVARAALAGLTATPKTLPPWLFYDPEGCRLFYEITRLPEYYLTRTEDSVLAAHVAEMVPDTMRHATLVEFGASTEHKARRLLDLRDAAGTPVFDTFVPVDVAQAELMAMRARLARSHPALRVKPVVADFMRPLALPGLTGPVMGYFPGSTIGNLNPVDAADFLVRVRAALGEGAWLLLGADLRKDPAIVLPAYDDAAGVTAAFNLNLLTRLNREADGRFDLAAFAHRAVWNDRDSRIEMHLVSRTEQSVPVAGRTIRFHEGETIHTENSYKHPPAALRALARSAGWQAERSWTDAAGWFGVFLFRS
jgi:dimethylhistidine N-methyltransferase